MNLTKTHNPTAVIIDCDALEANYHHLSALAGSQTEVAAVVKADAYGHGLHGASLALHRAGCRTFCIATTDEAVHLRQTFGESVAIIKLLPSLPCDFETIHDLGIEQAIASTEDRKAWESFLKKENSRLKTHLKADCGMGRLGLMPHELLEESGHLSGHPNFDVVGLMSHLPCSEEPEKPDPSVESGSHASIEIDRFKTAAKEAERRLGKPCKKHIGNSGGLLFHPSGRMDMVRCGLALYGGDPRQEDPAPYGLKPVLSFKSELVQVRMFEPGASIGYGRAFRASVPMKVGVLPVGYADGLLRRFAEQGFVLLHGKRCKILGRISMNLISIDLSEVESAAMGDAATLIGWDGDEHISAETMASWGGTINYEIFTTIDQLGTRNYTSSQTEHLEGMPQQTEQP